MFPKVKKEERCRNQEHRDILAMILKSDKSARQTYKHLLRSGAKDMRPDYMLVRNDITGKYDYAPDFGAWNMTLPAFGGFHACLIRRKENDWSLHS